MENLKKVDLEQLGVESWLYVDIEGNVYTDRSNGRKYMESKYSLAPNGVIRPYWKINSNPRRRAGPSGVVGGVSVVCYKLGTWKITTIQLWRIMAIAYLGWKVGDKKVSFRSEDTTDLSLSNITL